MARDVATTDGNGTWFGAVCGCRWLVVPLCLKHFTFGSR